MEVITVGPESQGLVEKFCFRWIGSENPKRTLLHLDRIQETKLLTSLVAKTALGQQFVLAVVDAGDVVGLLYTQHRSWDTEFFEVPVNHIGIAMDTLHVVQRQSIVRELVNGFLGSISRGRRYIVAKVDLADTVCIRSLENRGFRFLVPMQTFGRKSLVDGNCGRDAAQFDPDINPWTPSDLDSLTSVARSAFLHTRFHVEPAIPRHKADELHALWIYNCCMQGLADEVLAAKVDGCIVGFIALKINRVNNVELGNIVLTAIDPSFRGLGIGTRLVRSAVMWFGNKADYLTVTTEATNLSAIATYGRVGYRVEATKAYLSRWLDH